MKKFKRRHSVSRRFAVAALFLTACADFDEPRSVTGQAAGYGGLNHDFGATNDFEVMAERMCDTVTFDIGGDGHNVTGGISCP